MDGYPSIVHHPPHRRSTCLSLTCPFTDVTFCSGDRPNMELLEGSRSGTGSTASRWRSKPCSIWCLGGFAKLAKKGFSAAAATRFLSTSTFWFSTGHRAAGAGSTTNQSRWSAQSARWDGLTFDTKGESIVWSSGSHLYPARRLDVVLPLLRIHLS